MMEEILSYYNRYDEEGRLSSKHGQVEFLTTMRYIERYLRPGMRLLEIGPGPGRYSHTLAGVGYRVDAVELVERNIELFKSKITPGESISIRQGDATDLSFIANNTYDMTLLLGPMYHLFTLNEKLKALSEALRVTKEGGLLFVSYCNSDASILDYGFIKGHIHELIEKNMVETEGFSAFSKPLDIFELHRKEDIDAMMAGLGAQRLHYVATDLYTNHMQGAVDAMDDKTFELYLKYHYTICERPDMVGITHHSLDVSRKRELTLVRPATEHKEAALSYRQEHFDYGEYELSGTSSLWNTQSYELWLDNVNNQHEGRQREGLAPATAFFGMVNGEIAGMIQIRHELNDSLLKTGGHIGYGVRPTRRERGYAAAMLALALQKCREIGIKKALVTCDRANAASAGTILKNSGVLENEVVTTVVRLCRGIGLQRKGHCAFVMGNSLTRTM